MTSISQRNVPADIVQSLQASGVSPLMSRLLSARCVSDIAQTSIHLSALLPPQQLTQNQAMAKLLAEAIQANKKLLVVGDFLWSLISNKINKIINKNKWLVCYFD